METLTHNPSDTSNIRVLSPEYVVLLQYMYGKVGQTLGTYISWLLWTGS
jgi:hypothetical protein